MLYDPNSHSDYHQVKCGNPNLIVHTIVRMCALNFAFIIQAPRNMTLASAVKKSCALLTGERI